MRFLLRSEDLRYSVIGMTGTLPIQEPDAIYDALKAPVFDERELTGPRCSILVPVMHATQDTVNPNLTKRHAQTVPPTEQIFQSLHNLRISTEQALLFASDVLVHNVVLSRELFYLALFEVGSLASS
ncbi:hypothetical protein SERLA73DRAFT_186001 [Serpula lacrymans var. lacrymans S7.3]|uniref:Uncharacterized protein n=2 Tax=Serpula lacrymans var. lacrymans TaxID=341189 RepID=F8Q6S5_SERL3|nr:uncharacterized protein SERLADRAFT_474823 [Serpula lacrymans var. lacrymans S7.9]EGN96313.1 hypothetical protein SERLA73DRAFT_186001 [Serpula lacrymans var. lacrymans S7.3]EGO21850.1 hypothetical protein SERLADRAFT_474823 [Serpula lacrymans var. lacrymans S7.9]